MLTYSADCGVYSSAAVFGAWLDLDIYVNGVIVAPTIGTGDAFCSSNGTTDLDSFVRASITIPIQGVEGNNTVPYESTRETADETAAVVDVKLLERTLMGGTDSERHAALVRALEAGMELPPQFLWQTYASDPSERVRLLALTTYVDSASDDRASVRSALESAVQDPNTAVQTEARRRLAELDQFERMLAESLPQGM